MALTVIIALPFVFAVIVIVVTLPLLDVVTVATFVLLDVAVTVKSPASEGVTVAVNIFVSVPYVKLAVRVEVFPFAKLNDVLLRVIPVGLSVTLPTDSLKVKLVGKAIHCAYSVWFAEVVTVVAEVIFVPPVFAVNQPLKV